LRSPIFDLSPTDTWHWLDRCLCEEHQGLHINLKYHARLLDNLQRMFTDIDYLWASNREMQVMAKGGTIASTLVHNRKALAQFQAAQ
jgi:hypothetical protein